MAKVTIVSNEFSEEEKKILQEEADILANEHKYSPHAIMHHFGLRRNLSVSLLSENGEIIMNCRSATIKE